MSDDIALEDYTGRVQRAEPILQAYRKMLETARSQLAHAADIGAANPMLAHTVLRLVEARELVEASLADMAPDVVAHALETEWCVHCGRRKDPALPYCSDECHRCHEAPVPPGRPCQMICVSKLGPPLT